MDLTNDEDAPTSSMPGILAVAQQVHQRELDKRDEYIHNLQLEKSKLKEEHLNLQNKYSELRRSSIEDKGQRMSENQHYKQKLASLEEHIKELETERGRMQQELDHLTSERDKANHIIKSLLSKVRHSPIPH